MKVLLDAHTLIWAADDPSKLSPVALSTLQAPANELLVSAVTVWEIAIKVGLGKLTLSSPFLNWMNQALADLRAALVPITVTTASAYAALPILHRDPFDRFLAAQSTTDAVPIVSNDIAFDQYGVRRLW